MWSPEADAEDFFQVCQEHEGPAQGDCESQLLNAIGKARQAILKNLQLRKRVSKAKEAQLRAKAREHVSALRKKLHALQKEHKELLGAKRKAESLASKEKELLEKQKKTAKDLSVHLDAARRELQEWKERAHAASKRVAHSKTELEEVAEKLRGSQEELRDLKLKQKATEEEVTKLQAGKMKAGELQQKLQDLQQQHTTMEAKHTSLVQGLNNKLEALRKEKDEVERRLREEKQRGSEDLEQKLQGKNQELQSLKAQLAELKSQAQTKDQEVKRLRENEDRISSSLSEADATQQRAREELESQLRDLKAQVENQRSEKQTTVQDLEKRNRSLEEQVKRLEADLKKREKLAGELESMRTKYKTAVHDIDSWKKQYHHIKSSHDKHMSKGVIQEGSIVVGQGSSDNKYFRALMLGKNTSPGMPSIVLSLRDTHGYIGKGVAAPHVPHNTHHMNFVSMYLSSEPGTNGQKLPPRGQFQYVLLPSNHPNSGSSPWKSTKWVEKKSKHAAPGAVRHKTKVPFPKGISGEIPRYFVSLAASSHHWIADGMDTVHSPYDKGFEYMFNISPGYNGAMKEFRWHVQFFACYDNRDPKCGKQTSGWKAALGGRAISMDVNTSKGKFKKTPVYVTSIEGDGQHELTHGGSILFQDSASSFRVYLQKSAGPAVSVKLAQEMNWGVNWFGASVNAILPSGVVPSGSAKGVFDSRASAATPHGHAAAIQAFQKAPVGKGSGHCSRKDVSKLVKHWSSKLLCHSAARDSAFHIKVPLLLRDIVKVDVEIKGFFDKGGAVLVNGKVVLDSWKPSSLGATHVVTFQAVHGRNWIELYGFSRHDVDISIGIRYHGHGAYTPVEPDSYYL